MILELNGTKVTIVDKTLGYQGDNLVDTIQVTVDKDSTWNYKLDMYKGKSKCFDSVLMTREGNICTVQLTNEILSYGGRYVFQLRGYTDTQTYHSDIFESWVNASIEYQDDCKQTDCGCDCKLPTEFYQVEDNVTEINNHPPYPGDNGKWMIWDVDRHEYVESDIEVIAGGEDYQTKANLTTSITAESTDEQYPSAKATYDAIQNASVVTVKITGSGTDSDPYVSSMTYDEIYSAMKADKTVVGIKSSSNPAFFIACISFSSLITFTRLAVLNIMNDDVICESYTIFKDGHITHKNSRLEETANKVTSLSADSTDRQYPSAKATYEYGQSIAESAGKINAITVNGTAQTVEDKTAKIIVNKSTVGLGNVNNTSDENKPVSTLQATAIADAKKAGTDAQANLIAHINDKENPHEVTKAQVGLGDVDNTSDVNKPISTATQNALNEKLDKTAVVDVTVEATKGQAADAKSVYDALQASPTGTDISLGLTGANVGDTVMVAAVDEKGAPTKWESSGWRTIAEIVTDDQAVQYELTEDSEGNPLVLSEVILRYAYGDAGYAYEAVWINGKQVSYRHAAPNNDYQTFWLRKVGKHLYGIDTRTTADSISGMNTGLKANGIALNIFPNNEKIQKIKFGAAYSDAYTGVTVTVLGR